MSRYRTAQLWMKKVRRRMRETPTEVATAMPPEQITLTKQPYVSLSNAFTINFPENWNCSETGDYRVDCYAPSNTSGGIGDRNGYRL